MKIDLSLDAQIEFEYEAECVNHTPGGDEHIPALVTITSVKCKGIELIALISKEELQSMEEQILKEEF